ncbi:hypothetical protein RYX36_014868 [Vicia faba]
MSFNPLSFSPPVLSLRTFSTPLISELSSIFIINNTHSFIFNNLHLTTLTLQPLHQSYIAVYNSHRNNTKWPKRKQKNVVPESVLKKQKRNEEWALVKKQEQDSAKKKRSETRKLIWSRAKQYTKEYDDQQKQMISSKREAKLKGGFYVDPEAKLLFIVRIRG